MSIRYQHVFHDWDSTLDYVFWTCDGCDKPLSVGAPDGYRRSKEQLLDDAAFRQQLHEHSGHRAFVTLLDPGEVPF